MKKLLFFAALAAFVACTKLAPEQTETPGNSDMPEQVEPQEVTIYATATDTKTQLDGDNVKWSVGDAIKVCFAPGSNMDMYRDKYGTTFDFTLSNLDESAETALFKGSYSSSTDRGDVGLAFYPNDNDLFSYQSLRPKYMSSITYTISYDIPSEQQIVEDGSFAPNINPSWAPILTKDMDNNVASVAFRNLCALIKINMPQEDYNVKEILIESANTERGCLSGNVSLTWNSSNQSLTTPEGYKYPSDNTTVTLTKADGTNLTPGASYYAVVWPIAHAGLKFTFIDADGNEAVKQTPSGKNYTFNAGKYHTFNISSLSFDVAPYLNIDVTSLSVPAGGATNSFFVVANNPVSVSSPSNGWLSVTYDGSQVTAVAAANEGVTERTATITITSAGETKTVTVTQPPVYYERGAVVDDVRNLNEDDSYMIFNTNANWVETDKCWKLTDGAGNLSATSFNDGKITVDQLFKFKKSSLSVASNWNGYSEVIVGSLYSPYNSYYLTTTFRFEGSGSGINFIFASSWGGASSNDIDIWNYNNTNQTLKWSNGLAWGSNDGQGQSARKFYIYKVSVAK